MDSDAKRLREIIAEADDVVVFTGAGMSTESGVPDFRSPGGVWSRMTPILFQDFVASEEVRREAWRRVFSGAAGWTGAKPNRGHRVIARLVAEGKVSTVITQNVDNLHQEAGAPPDRVLELHGNAGYATCLDCGLRHELEQIKAAWTESGPAPRCSACDGLVKTATISFGQPLPAGILSRAEDAAHGCDVFLVLGSSLRVYPAAGLPLLARRAGARLVIVNREPTDQDSYADLVLHAEIGEPLSAL